MRRLRVLAMLAGDCDAMPRHRAVVRPHPKGLLEDLARPRREGALCLIADDRGRGSTRIRQRRNSLATTVDQRQVQPEWSQLMSSVEMWPPPPLGMGSRPVLRVSPL